MPPKMLKRGKPKDVELTVNGLLFSKKRKGNNIKPSITPFIKLKGTEKEYPANTSTLIFGWKWKLSRRTFIDVVSTLTKQRWNNVDRITSIQRRWTNVVSTLKFGWKWKLSRRMFIDVVSTLKKQRWNNIDRITLIPRRWSNVVSTFIAS